MTGRIDLLKIHHFPEEDVVKWNKQEDVYSIFNPGISHIESGATIGRNEDVTTVCDYHANPHRKGIFLGRCNTRRWRTCWFSPQQLLLFLLPPFALCSSLVAESVPTYEHQDPSTGKTLLCVKCPPGMHMTAHCTASAPTKCLPCGENQFTELWNYLPRCLYCSNFCYDNQEVEKECSATNNRVCRCKEALYWSSGFCFRHSECKPGLGVKAKGKHGWNVTNAAN